MSTMCELPASKWKSVFELLLFRELRDDVDDTLVQKLTSFVDSTVIENREYAHNIWQEAGLHESIPRALDVSRRAASVAFALRLISAFSQDERSFINIKEATRVLEKVAHDQDTYVTEDASVKVAYLHMLSTFLRHRSGHEWAIEQGLFPKVFTYLQDGSIFVQNEAEKFLSCYLSQNLSTDPEVPEGRLLLDGICSASHARHAKQCLRIFEAVLAKNPDSAEVLCSKLKLDVRLLEILKDCSTSVDDASVAELLCHLLCTKKEWNALVHVVDLLETTGKQATLVRVASTVLQTNGNPSANIKSTCFEVLTAAIAALQTPAIVSSALCSLRQVVTSLRDQNTNVRLLDCLASFLSRAVDPASRWSKQTRILAVACECFRACLRGVGFAELDQSKVEPHLRILLKLLPSTNLSCHAIEEAFLASTTLALTLFAQSPSDFCWTSSAGLRELADLFRRHLVSTDPQVVETALEVFAEMTKSQAALGDAGKRTYLEWLADNALPRFVWDTTRSTEENVRACAVSTLGEVCAHDHLWHLLRDSVPVTEADVVKLMTATAVADANVFARRSAAAVLSRWVSDDTLGANARHGTAVRRAASESVAFDLDSEVQRCGLCIWRSCLELELNKMVAEGRGADGVTDLFERADFDGLGTALGRLLVLDCDETMRKEAVGLLGGLRSRLRREFDFVVGRTDDKGLLDRISKLSERCAEEERSTSTAEERYAAAEEVLDETVSECLQRKLVDCRDKRGSQTDDRFLMPKTEVTTLQLMGHGFETVNKECGWKRADSVVDDILGAAATEHRDLDCY